MKVRTQIIAFIDGPLVVGILTTVILSTILLFSNHPSTIDILKDTSVNEEVHNLGLVAKNKGTMMGELVEEAKAALLVYANGMKDLVEGTVTANTGLPYYYGARGAQSQSAVPNMQWNELYQRTDSPDVSLVYSSEFNLNPTPVNLASDLSAHPNTEALIDATGPSDVAAGVLHGAKDAYFNIYTGFYEGGLMRMLPYRDIQDSWVPPPAGKKTSYICESPYPSTQGQTRINYDPRCRPWYRDAVNANGTLTLGYPYEDSGTGLLVLSPAKFVSTATSDFVSALDLDIDVLRDMISGAKIMESGYVFVVDRNGIMALHPNMSKCGDIMAEADKAATALCSLDDVEFFNYEPDITAFKLLWDEIRAGKSGSGTYLKHMQDPTVEEGLLWYLSFEPVPGTDYIMGVAVPESDVLAASNEIQKASNSAMAWQIVIFVLVFVALALILRKLTIRVANSLTRPLVELTNMVESVRDDDLSVELYEMDGGSKDVDELYSTFRGLLVALRFGNSAFFSGDLGAALGNYEEAMELFRRLENNKGIGIAHNNIGNVHFQAGQYLKSRAEYEKAIAVAESLVKEVEKEYEVLLAGGGDPEKDAHTHKVMAKLLKLRKTVATRYSNLATVLVELDEVDLAFSFLEAAANVGKAFRIYSELVKHLVSIAELHINRDKLDMADHYTKEACVAAGVDPLVPPLVVKAAPAYGATHVTATSLPEVKDPPARRRKPTDAELDVMSTRQWALYGRGIVSAAQNDHRAAVLWFASALEDGEYSDLYVKSSAAQALVVSMREMGFEDAAVEVCKKLGVQVGGVAVGGPKDVVICLDQSYSMSGRRIAAAGENLLKIFEQYVNEEDEFGVLGFHNRVDVCMPLKPKKEWLLTNWQGEFKEIARVKGSTALYDSIRRGITELERKRTNGKRQQWCIVLTDGEDNMSQIKPSHLQQAVRETSVNLICITLFLRDTRTRQFLKELVGCSDEGMFIEVTNEQGLEALDEAFEQVAQHMTGAKLVVESF